MMTYQEALAYIHTNFWQGSRPGLDRTRELLKKIGNPEKKLSFVHVAGTNGKGSFCAMLSSILKESGRKVGTYTSPYILRFNERMKINGVDIPDGELVKLVEYIRPFAEEMNDKPTEFELITVIALEYFAREECDVVVLECGMGGRLDSTNVIDAPLVSVITGIALDHTAFLGDSIQQIAREKAGIIKAGAPTLFCQENPAAERVIRDRAKEVGSKLYRPLHRPVIQKGDLSGTLFDWGEFKGISLPLLGSYQPENAGNVLTAVQILREQGLQIDQDSIFRGMKNVRWPARFEVVRKDPVIICDGGHNPQGVDAAVESVRMYLKDRKVLAVTGVMADKDYTYMAKSLAGVLQKAYCITPDNPRALAAEDLAHVFQAQGIPAEGYKSVPDALKEAVADAKKEGLVILCIGSLYMYAQIREAMEKIL